MAGLGVEGSRGKVAGQLTDFCMLSEQFWIESACIPGANEDVQDICWLDLGNEAEQHEIES